MYTQIYRLSLLSIALLICVPTYAQSPKFKHFTTEDGFLHNVGYDIHQDQEGFLWFAMDNGLSRFDGVNFKHYTVNDGLNSPYIITLSEDLQGNIWTGTHKQGINYFLKDSIHSLNINPHIYLNAKIVHHKEGHVLINENTFKKRGTDLVAIKTSRERDKLNWYYFYEEKGEMRSIELDSSKLKSWNHSLPKLRKNKKKVEITLSQGANGRVFFLTSLGVYTYNPSTFLTPYSPDFFEYAFIHEMEEDLEGNLWFLGNTHLFIQEKNGGRKKIELPSLFRESIIQFKVINAEEIYLLSAGWEKLYRWNSLTYEIQEISNVLQLESHISFIEKDREGNLWLSNMGEGIFCIYKPQFTNYTIKEGLNNLFINSIREDYDASMIISTLRGVKRITQEGVQDMKWIKQLFPKVKEVFDLYPLRDERYLITMPGETIKLVSPQHGIYPWVKDVSLKKIKVSQNDSLMIFQAVDVNKCRKLFSVHLQDLTYRTQEIQGIPFLSHGESSCIPVKGHPSIYWFSGDNGLMTIQGGEAISYPLLPETGSKLINYMTSDDEGNNWFGTEKGLFQFDGEEMHWVNQKYAWPVFPVRHIIFDKKQQLWMATPTGLYNWNGDSLSRYTTSYGLVSNDVRTLQIDSKDRLWVGTSSGISRIDLDKFPLTSSPPVLRLTGIYLDQQLVSKQDINKISSNTNFHVTYQAISLLNPDKLEYAYRLSPHTPWQFTSSNNLDLSNQKEGDYQLEIKARKFNSRWSSPIKLPFQIAPLWWRSFWAYLFYGCMLFGLVLLISYMWGRYVKQKARFQSQIAYEKAQLKLQMLQSQLNPHFIFNALNVIQGYILENDIDASNTYLERFSQLMRRFLESSKQNEILLSQELRLINLFVEMEQLCYEDKFQYELQVDKNLALDAVMVPSMLIQPFVENAIQHGLLQRSSPGHLLISFNRSGDSLICEVIDNGIGRKESQRRKKESDIVHVSRGMQIIRERLKIQNYLHKENIQINITDRITAENEIEGTRVEIICPLKTLDRTL